MARSKGLIFLLGFLFLAIFLGYFLINVNPNYPKPTNMSSEITKGDLHWIDYVSPNKVFSVKFPNLPQTTSKMIVDPETKEKRNYEVYVSQKGDVVYLINRISFPEMKSAEKDDEILMEVANDMMTKHPENKLIKTQAGKFKGNPSLTFSLASDKVEIDALTFINNKSIYVLTRIAPKELAVKGEFEYFINSFELK